MASSGSPSNDHPSTANVPVDTTPLPPTNYPQGFRRARAGTLPSNVQLAAQRFAAASETLQSQPVSTDSFLDTYSQQPSATTANASMANTRPALRHSASISSSAATSRATSSTMKGRTVRRGSGVILYSLSWTSRSATHL